MAPESTGLPGQSNGRLRQGALSFPSILMQAITHIAPAVGLLLTIQFTASSAGILAPLTYAIAFVIVLTLGISLTQLAKHLPSAGGYYTYISRTVHPKMGFLTAWLYFLYDPAATALNLAFMGYFFEAMLRTELSVAVPWWSLFIPAALLVGYLAYRGIEVSTSTMVWLSLAEIAIIVGLAFTGILHAGSGGVNIGTFLPHAPPPNGFYLGVVFSIFAFTGFESVAPLAEESRDPKRSLPQSIIVSLLLMGVFFVVCSWALLVGWGANDIASFIRSPENPTIVLAKRLWGKAWILVAVAVLNSILGVSIASTNAATRVFYAMGRIGVLPSRLAAIHPRYRTPVNAIWLQTFCTLVIGLGLGFWMGPESEYLFLGLMMTLALVLVYSFGNFGVWLFYRHERRGEFNVFLHAIFPLLSTVALIWVGYNSIVPLPAAPLRYAGPVVGFWLLAGGILAASLPGPGSQTQCE